MRKTRQTVFVLLSAALAALSLSARPAESTLKIAVNMTTIESFPILAAAARVNGVELLPAQNGRNAMAQLVSGNADAATGSETQALLNSVNDPRIRIILTLSECRYRIIARRSAGIRRLSDLRGKKIAVTLNTSSHYYLSRMLSAAHLTERDIELVTLEGPDMPAALEKKSVDAVSIWEPHAQNSLSILGNDAVIFENPSAYTERFNLNTRADVLADPAKRAALLKLSREIESSSNQIRTRSAEMIPMLAAKIGYSERTVLAVWRQFTFPASLNGRLGAALNDVEPWVAASQKRQPRRNTELADLIDFSIVQRR
jgi:ABC-type nitrate/sulfonate/bicarbonate transport system substrate-binding protein